MKSESMTSYAAGSPDAELAQLAQRGDKRAFVEIVARHQAMVYGIAYGILGDFAASEDAAQDAFLTAWRKIHDLREPDRLRAWLGQIARTAALGYLRQQRGAVFVEGTPDAEDPAPQPDEMAASGEEAMLVRAALAKLPEIFRVPLVLFYMERQSVRMVAGALDLSEDAVKQRLSRGREMLRERVAGVIGSALGHSRPTAVFTMMIAAAIGALKAPAVLAGTAFSAAAASAATVTSAASAASTTSAAGAATATAMSTSKTSLTIAALIAAACLPLGYGARIGMEPRPDSVGFPEPPPASATAEGIAKPDFSNSALFAEWRKMHEEHGATPEAMPTLYKAISDIKDPVRRRIFRAAQIAEWAELDPEAGFAFFMEKGRDSAQRDQFFNEWLQRDASAAVAALPGGGDGWDQVARRHLTEIAKAIPGSVAALVARLPKSETYWGTEVRDAFVIVAAGGLETARTAAEGITGPNREAALAGIAMAWAKTDVDGAIAWAKSLPEGADQNNIIRAALIGLAGTDAAGALDQVKTIPPGGRENYFADTTGARVLAEAAKTDFDATVAWLKKHSGELGREDMMGLAKVVTDKLNEDPAAFLSRHHGDGSLEALLPAIDSALMNGSGGQRAAVWEWLKTQPVEGELLTLRRDILKSAGYQDPELALKLAREVPDTAEGKALMNDLARNLFGGNMLHRFDALMAAAPERLRQPLIENALSILQPDSLSYPQKWVDLLAGVAADKKLNLTVTVASVWAQLAPEAAMAWASALPVSDERAAALSGATGAWLRKDSWRASEWIAALPAGSQKDQAAGALVTTIAADSPSEAWEWAQTITDISLRSTAVIHTLQMVGKRDPAAARDWLAASRLSPEERSSIQTWLEENTVPGNALPTATPKIRQ